MIDIARPFSDYNATQPNVRPFNKLRGHQSALSSGSRSNLNASRIGSDSETQKSAKTGKSSKVLSKLQKRMNTAKLVTIGLNPQVMEQVKAEINEKMS